MENIKLITCKDKQDLAEQASNFWARCARDTLAEETSFFVALSGGSTPASVYERLPALIGDWSQINLFWGDERTVSMQDPESNYRMVNETLLQTTDIPKGNIHPVMKQTDVQQAASDYHSLLDKLLPKDHQAIPQFDLMMLGIGEDGHIASLFPETNALTVDNQWVVPVYVEKLKCWRITMTYPVINHAKHIMILASGQGKARVVADLISGKNTHYPVSRLEPRGQLTLFLDEDAAALIETP